MLFSVGVAQTIPGIGTVKPHDVLAFRTIEDEMYGGQYQYGPTTIGEISMYEKGSEHGLSTTTEKLDALEGFTYGDCWGWPVSTVGLASYNYGGLIKQDDEDVFCNYTGAIYNHWDYFLDVNGLNDGPSPVTIPGLPAEDVNGVSILDTYDRIALNIVGTGKILNHNVNQKDIFSVRWSDYTWGGYLWRGSQHGWNYNLDAFEMSDYANLYATGTAMDDGSRVER
jgi:hypothetical protein